MNIISGVIISGPWAIGHHLILSSSALLLLSRSVPVLKCLQFCVTVQSQLSFPFKSASHLCTQISPFVYPRFKLKMQSGVKFEIKQWCWFGTQNSVLEYNRLDTTHLIIVTESVGDLLISHIYTFLISQFKHLTFVFYSSSFWLDSLITRSGTEGFKFYKRERADKS